ncbi:MAG: serine/threonine-protein kinase, partial [Thermoanaerobaculia bacterium]
MNRDIAIKILPSALLDRRDRVLRFIQEAKSASALSHPHIVTIHEIGETSIDGHAVHYIAMELIEGSTLRQAIYSKRTPLPQLIELLAQVADALAKAHAAGIVHRDLKPDNIMVTADGYAKIVDFGLAKLIEADPAPMQASVEGSTLPRTRDGVMLGTVGYMSPEQVEGKPADHRSDIFSLGCILYEAVARARPFEGDSEFDTLNKVRTEEPPPLKG